MSVDDGPAERVVLGGTGDDRWDRPQGETLELRLREGTNTISLGQLDDYAPDIDKITIQP